VTLAERLQMHARQKPRLKKARIVENALQQQHVMRKRVK